MNITVLGSGRVRRKQVTTALDSLAEGASEVLLYAGTLDPDVAPDGMRFATDWATDRSDVQVEIVDSDGLCASYADVVLVAWDDTETDAIESWVRATKGKVLDVTNELAEISLEGEPDEAQQPSDARPVHVTEGEKTNPCEEVPTPALSVGTYGREETAELLELGKAVRTLLNYVVARTNGSY